ncbi:MAG: YtxH domain-containing protein [Candidatus Levybacteria bacterium]|nr:YtxH domain-containing protein [Candidatus Levybacteria bacterium]
MERREEHSNNWASGFLIGVVVGIGLALLFTTKKGRKVLKVLTDEGFSRFSKWEDVMNNLPEDDDEPVEAAAGNEESLPTETPKEEKETPKPQANGNGHAAIKRISTHSRRLFKGISRKS